MAWLAVVLIVIPWIAALLSLVGTTTRGRTLQKLSALLLFGLLAGLARAFIEIRLIAFEFDGFTWMEWPTGAATAGLRLDAISVFFAAPAALVATGIAVDLWSRSRATKGARSVLVSLGFWLAGLFSADILIASLCFGLAGLTLAGAVRARTSLHRLRAWQIWIESSIFFFLIGLTVLSEANNGSLVYASFGEYGPLDLVLWILVVQSAARLILAVIVCAPLRLGNDEAVSSRWALFNGAVGVYWLARTVATRYTLELDHFPFELAAALAAAAILAALIGNRRGRGSGWHLGFFWSAVGLILASAGSVTAGLTIFLGTSLAYAGRRWLPSDSRFVISAIVWANNLSLPGSISFSGYLLLLSSLLLLPPDSAIPLVALLLIWIVSSDGLAGLRSASSAPGPKTHNPILTGAVAAVLATLALAPAGLMQELLGPPATNFFPAEGGPAGPQLLFVWNYVGLIPLIAVVTLIAALITRELVAIQHLRVRFAAAWGSPAPDLSSIALLGAKLPKALQVVSLSTDRNYVPIIMAVTLIVTFIFLR